MPIYLYRCDACGKVAEVEMSMHDDHPHIFGPHWCGDTAMLIRLFTIPGMRILRPEEEGGWKIEAPGQVGGPRRNKKWRDRFVKKEDKNVSR